MRPGSGIGNIVTVLSAPTYGAYTAGNLVALTGFWMQRVVTGWLTWQLTQSGAWLGLVAFADLFPTVLLGPLAGAVADRWDRVRVTKVTQIVALLQALTFFALTVTGLITPPLILVLALVSGCAAAFNQPARLALTPALVPPAHLNTGVAIASMVFNLARFLGPAAAGLIIAVAGIPLAYAVNGAAIALFLLILSRLSIAPTVAPGQPASRLGDDLRAGLRYTLSHGGLATVLALMLAANVGSRPLIELLPGFTAEVFRRDATGLAVLTSSAGAGAVLAGLWLSSRSAAAGLSRILMLATLAVAVSAALFTMTDRLWVGAVLLLATGFAMASNGIAAETLIQRAVDTSMRGRVLGIYALLFRGGPALGALVMGAAAEFVGLRMPVQVGAVGVVLVFLWAWLRRRQVLATTLGP